MKYTILASGCHQTLEMQVNEAIGEGWTPLGGISVAQSFQSYENQRKGGFEHNTEYTYAQAMTRDESGGNKVARR